MRFLFFIIPIFLTNHAFAQAYNFSYLRKQSAWYPISLISAPSGRQLHTAVWTGSKMIIWGGDTGVDTNTGGLYDPTTDSWTPTSTGANVPGAQSNHSAVWTGSKMIVWGGYDGGNTNTGGLYDPATDSWTPTSTGTNVAGKRFGHSAVWTGSKMIIWGGYLSGIGALGDGGVYDPATDTWTTVSTGANAPSARSSFSAVWTGSKMVIWGGMGASLRNDGGQYDPTSNTWTLTSTGTNVPSVRYEHSTVWTGSKMIIWGGNDGAALNTGAIYDPTADTWVATSTGANVPPARQFYHWQTEVWAGSKMIIWGGHVAGASVNTGALYDPATDTWQPTSVEAGVPLPRVVSTSVWTGTKMIVWGGSNLGPKFNSGGLYTPP